MRIKARWEAIDKENIAISLAKDKGSSIKRICMKTEIRLGNFYPETGIYSLKKKASGQYLKEKEQRYSSESIRILKRSIIYPCNWDSSITSANTKTRL